MKSAKCTLELLVLGLRITWLLLVLSPPVGGKERLCAHLLDCLCYLSYGPVTISDGYNFSLKNFTY